jgi:hypothetical protein
MDILFSVDRRRLAAFTPVPMRPGAQYRLPRGGLQNGVTKEPQHNPSAAVLCRVSVDNIPRLWRDLICQEALEGLPEDLKATLKC